MNIQWYPGHMTKTRRMMEENISLVDIVIELLDARLPFSSKNPEIDNLARNKKRIVILNKVDLADEKKTKEWKNSCFGIGTDFCFQRAGTGSPCRGSVSQWGYHYESNSNKHESGIQYFGCEAYNNAV